MTLETVGPIQPGPAPRGGPMRTASRRLIACLVLVACGSAAGQAAGPPASQAASQPAGEAHDKHVFSDVVTEIYDGTWTATFDRGGVGPTGTATFVLADFAGTWHDVGPAALLKDSVCGAKPRPVTVQLSQKVGFAFTVFGVDVSPKCPDLTVYVKHIDANTLEGTVESKAFAGEQKIRLVRKPQAPRRR
ncbi:MAG TPA: hypothetical protein VLD35_16160 [Caldimonas sp.]|nr:hypothetical protein [Caldimonas sp.]